MKLPRGMAAARAKWRWNGSQRPPFADAPPPDGESVWDYPRPPRMAPDHRRVTVSVDGRMLVDTSSSVRVLETASPPTFYLPPHVVADGVLQPVAGESWCEWKGRAAYFDVVLPARRITRSVWCYPDPFPEFAALAGWLAFYPAAFECRVDGERVQPQPGGVYGGWVTAELAGPWKGGPGTAHW